MGLGRLLTRSTTYTASDSVTGAVASYTVIDNLGPDWPSSSAYQGGMGIPGAYRAAVLLSDLIGGFPWNAYRQPAAGGPETLVLPRPPLLEQPSYPEPRIATFSGAALDLIWHGNAVWIIAARNPLGWPTAVYPVPACSVSVRRIGPFDQSPLPVGAIEYKIGALTFGSEDLIHIKGPAEPGAVRGLGVLELHLNSLNLISEQDRQARGVATHGVPTGILKSTNPNVEEDEALAMKASWMRSQSTRSVAVLNATTEFTPLSWNPEELQLIEARKFSLNVLELIFGLPVGWLGGMNSARQYSNIEQDEINLLKFSLGGHLARFEQTLSLAFPRGTQVRANTDALLRSDTLTRYQAHKIGLEAGFLTDDEVRDMEHRPPLTSEQRKAMKPDSPPPDAFTQKFDMPAVGAKTGD